ncbi:MAG TPA: ParB N-terminal domain-containing protein [Acidimicrobiia bacterium]
MSLVPPLRVVPLESVMRHEEYDPLSVERLADRIEAEGTQRNPVICVEAEGDGLVVLDGATRTEALRRLGVGHVVVQIVDPSAVTLETWHHVVRGARPTAVMDRIASRQGLILAHGGDPPRVTPAAGTPMSAFGEGLSPNAVLATLVSGYIGRWRVSRIIDPDPDVVTTRFPDWALIVEFPPLKVSEVMKAAIGQDLLPAGVTRFLVPERVLRLNADLRLLRSPGSLDAKQEALDLLIQARSQAGRVRRYEETVVILDD